MKNIYIAAQVKKENKFYAYIIPVRIGSNLEDQLQFHPDTPIKHLCETRKQAAELVKDWNETFKRNHTYLFDTTTF